MDKNSIVLIPGATGKMGECFLEKFQALNYDVVGLSHNLRKETKTIKYVDLLDKEGVSKMLKKVSVSSYKEIYLIHSIGPFVFEEKGYPDKDENQDGIDDEIYKSNFLTFKNISEELASIVNGNKEEQLLTLCAFGSVSDKYNVPWWQSYSKSKNLVRVLMREKLINERVRGVFINVGSTEKEGERPFANKDYWLACREVVDGAIGSILEKKSLNWQEIDIFKPNPEYHEGYFNEHEKLRERWLYEMYGGRKKE